MATKFYRCRHCGNVIHKVVDSKVPVVCCGEKMQELIPNTVDAGKEKHLYARPVKKLIIEDETTGTLKTQGVYITDGKEKYVQYSLKEIQVLHGDNIIQTLLIVIVQNGMMKI